VLESGDANEIRQKTEALEQASLKLAEAVYAQASAQQAAAGATGGNGTGAPSDDEVVEEADYEVIDEEEAKTS
ncbi:MAG: molecular chaperone DnaK, partial [Actinomycetota bacterium]|nr:molecular chaperone DnaK [Actinomycetota bacterium]